MRKSKKVICIIPARGGSKGLKNKNILKLNGHPLIAYPISAAKKSNVCDEIFVSTDDQDIASVAIKYGASVPFLRPKKFSKDQTTTEDTLKHSLLSYEKFTNIKFDICLYLTATDIFRKPSWIKEAVTNLKKNNKIQSCFSANPTHKNYWHIRNNVPKRILKKMKIYSSRQQKEPIYREDTGLVCASRADLWRKGVRIGDKVKLLISDLSDINIDIHSHYDFFFSKKNF